MPSTTLNLFGGTEEAAKPVEATSAQQQQMEEELAMAAEFRNQMTKRLQEAKCEGTSGGVTVSGSH